MSEETIVWMNGEFLPANEVPLSAFDLGVSVGLGVFETMIAYRGVLPDLHAHYCRLESAAALLKLDLVSEEMIAKLIASVIAENKLERETRTRVRITLGAGEHKLTAKKVSRAVENYLIISAVPQPAPAPFAQLALVPMRYNEHGALSGVKSTSYAENILAYRHAASAGADEAVLLNTSGNLCECSMSNIFLVKKGEVLTPALSSGCLPGVTRASLSFLCPEADITFKQCDLTEEDLFSADEIFITSTARGLQPAKMMGSSTSCPGELTKRLAAAYRDYIKEQTEL